MDLSDESDHNSVYNSDQIDSETEVLLYGAIHHSIDGHNELRPDVNDSENNSKENESKLELMESRERHDIDERTQLQDVYQNSNREKISSDKPLSNLFKVLDSKLDESDEEFYKDFYFSEEKSRNKRKFDVIQIDDSSDSDVVIIEDDNSFVYKSKPLLVSTPKSPQKSPKRTQLDISLGNVSNLNDSTLEIMDQFYNEDNFDSEEEAKDFSRMSSDRNVWKINRMDTLLTNNKNNRYYRNRFICNNCSERGHKAADCPLPKKEPICFLCGFTGHMSGRCRSVLCSRCLSGSHKTINCKLSVNQLVCDECGVGGHETNQCTYNWRKYHLTTSSSEEPMISNLRQNRRKCCWNCGSIGKHFGFECHLKSIEKHMIPVSVLMPNTRKSHCFNGRQRNNRRNDCPEKALFNEFVKSISSNELSRLSASFNKPLERSDLGSIGPSTNATITSTFNNKNKHIKWVYPETNGTTHLIASSYTNALNESHPFIRNCQKNRVIAEPTHQTVLNANISALNSAHTLTPTQTHQQINNSMQEKSQTQTTPQLNERSKRRKNKRKKRKIVEIDEEKGVNSFKQSNSSNFISLKQKKHLKRIKDKIKTNYKN